MESVDKQRHSKQMDYMEKALCEATTERDEVVGRIGQLKRRLEELQCSQVQIEQRLSERNEKLKVRKALALPFILLQWLAAGFVQWL